MMSETRIGMQLLVRNSNDNHTVYDITLNMNVLDINGMHAMISTTARAITIDKLATGESGTLNVFTFGLPGLYSITAKISYDINSRTYTQTVTDTLFMFGFFTFVINK